MAAQTKGAGHRACATANNEMNVCHYFAVTAGLVLACSAIAIDLPINNPGFEASTSAWTGWESSQHVGEAAYEMIIDSADFAEGERSFRMRRLSEQVYGALGQRVVLPKDSSGTLHFSAMLRTKGVGAGGWMLYINFLGRPGDIITQVRSPPLSGDSRWQRVILSRVIPDRAYAVEISAVLLDGGTAWLDDVRLRVDIPETQ